ncbi:MAG TPA: hypothetical protein VGO33_02890, partial [Gemmatimonadaceae bacterium]|nr:hypothetical protein [Gemmatimonadaceae bacterium]
VVGALSTALVLSCTPANSGMHRNSQIYSAIERSEELSRTSARTAYDVVEQVRPTFLRPPIGTDPPNVYLDGMLIGGIAELRSISAGSLQQIQFLTAMEAAGRYGRVGRFAPAIVLSTRKYGF